MRKLLIGLFSSLLLLTSLSACSSNAITNKRLEADILSLEDLSLITKVDNLSIIEKTQDASKSDYKISASLNAANFTATADISLNYTKTNDQWNLSSSTVEIIRVVPKNDPTLVAAVSQVVSSISNKILDSTFIGANSKRFKLDSMNSDKENGKATMVISESYDDGVFSMDATYTVEAKYDMKLGWSYEIKDWISHETTHWSGTYDIKFLEDPDFPGGALNHFYTIGVDASNIRITGDATVIQQFNKTEIFSSSVNVSFMYNGIMLSAAGEFDSVEEYSAHTFYFNFRPNNNTDSFLVFWYFPLISNNPHGFDSHFAVSAEWIFGNLVKQP